MKASGSSSGGEQRPILVTRPPSSEEKWILVQRVAASTPFQKAPRLRDFLLYVSERTLKHDLDNVRESNIGFAVFGRPPDYNPGEDNIVRVEARHLRKRLADYFAAEGKDEPYIIAIPKGSYMPAFVARESLGPETEQGSAAAEPSGSGAEVETPAAPPPEPSRWRHALHRYSLPAALSVALLLCAWLVVRNHRLESQLAGSRADRAPHFPWNAVFNERPARIALADSCLALLGDTLGRRIRLNEYVSRGYMNSIRQYESNPAMRTLLETLAGRQYTSLADVMFVSKIMQITGGLQKNVVIGYARNLNIRDFKTDNFVLVGSPRANPWVELFEPKMNFLFDVDTTLRRPLFRNRAARPGEQAVYLNNGADGRSNASYAVVALLPNLSRTGNVLIIEGTNMEGTEAGIEYLTDPDLARQLPRALAARVEQRSPNPVYFEILLKLESVGGTSDSVEPAAYRILND